MKFFGSMKRLAALLPMTALLACSSTDAARPPARQAPANKASGHSARGDTYRNLAPSVRDNSDPALWVLRDHDTTIYLFGTLHALTPGQSWFNEEILAAFRASSELVVEMVEPDTYTKQRLFKARAYSHERTPLSQRLSPAERARYRDTMLRFGLEPAAYERLQPWVPATDLTLARARADGLRTAEGVDAVLRVNAKVEHKAVIALESYADQIDIYAGMTDGQQRQYLMAALDEVSAPPLSFNSMEQAWSNGDTQALYAHSQHGAMGSPVMYDRFYTARNERFAAWIAARMARPGTVFVAVGAGHLVGPESVQAGLAARGMTVTRVRY